jgi:hypothetical protein
MFTQPRQPFAACQDFDRAGHERPPSVRLAKPLCCRFLMSQWRPCDFSVAQAYFARKAWLSGYWLRAIIIRILVLRWPMLAQSGQHSSLV